VPANESALVVWVAAAKALVEALCVSQDRNFNLPPVSYFSSGSGSTLARGR
jgi:hypothetical protein